MTELEEAVNRARRELGETRTAIAAARGETVEALAQELLAIQADAARMESKATELDASLQPLRDEVARKHAALAPSTPAPPASEP